MDNDPVAAIETCLRSEFPGARIKIVSDAESGRTGTTFFRIDDDARDYSLEIANEVLEDHRSPDTLQRFLERRELADHLRANEGRIVVLTENAYVLR